MRWPTLSHRAVEVLEELSRGAAYQPPAAGRGDDFPFAKLQPQKFGGRLLDRSTKNLLLRLGYVVGLGQGRIAIAEAGRDYLFALAVGDAPPPQEAHVARTRRERERRQA
jgi:hypothetical protein